MRKLKKFSIIIFSILFFDYILSFFIFKNLNIWNYDKLVKHYWRIPSEIYHHDLKPNINIVEPWGFSLKKKLITNSLGFRDFTNRKINKISDKKRILLIGDSAIEGAGYDYEFTLGGLLQNYFENKYEILNLSVGSYSPSIYLKKTNYFLERGFEFDTAILFLDPSDIIDELFIKKDEFDNIIVENEISSEKKIGEILVNNFLIFRTFLRISDATENLKNYLKLKYKASKKFNISFFKTTKEDALFYRMTHVDRSAWTFDDTIFPNYLEGLKKSEKNLNKLIEILNNNFIDTYLVLYPHPSQIYYEDLYHFPYWKKWSKKNNIKLINLYENFQVEDKRKKILNTFIFGDLHWNKNGNRIVFESLIKKIKFN